RRLTAAMAGWQFSRQPLRQGGAALLIVMAVATGTLALAQHQSWTRSTADQAAFTTGADVQVDLATPLPPAGTARLTHATGVSDAMTAVEDPETLPATILAVNSTRADGVVQLRGDESPEPAARLFGAIAPTATAGGTAVPGNPTSIRLTATLSRAPLGAATLMLTVTDATGGTFLLPVSGTLPADGRPHPLTAPLGGSGFAYPLRITQLTVTYALPERPYRQPVTLVVTGTALTGWRAVASSPELDSAGTGPGANADPAAASLQPIPGGATVTFSSGFGTTSTFNDLGQDVVSSVAGQVTLTAGNLTPAVVPAIATRAFDDANHTAPGQTVSATINGVTIPVRIAAQVNSFPTVTGSSLIMDLTTLQSLLVAHGGAPLAVTQWWLATAGHGVPPALTAALPPGSDVTSRDAVAAATASDPLSAAPQQALLAVVVAAALLAITGFLVSIAANVRQRRAENALLAALGVGQRSAAAQLFLEKLLLSVPAAALGLVLGTVVARLLVPAVTLTTTAQAPVPPAVTLLDLSQTVPFAVVVAVLPALAAALVVFRRPDPAAELRAAEAA
ncbi:MAG: FtsX-like permease family protein, partial [Trebonia sp.]